MECKSILLIVMNHITYLKGLSNFFSNSLIDFYSWEIVFVLQLTWNLNLFMLAVVEWLYILWCLAWNKTKTAPKLSNVSCMNWKSPVTEWDDTNLERDNPLYFDLDFLHSQQHQKVTFQLTFQTSTPQVPTSLHCILEEEKRLKYYKFLVYM